MADVTRAFDDVLPEPGPAHRALRLTAGIRGVGELGQIRVKHVDVWFLEMRKRRHPLPSLANSPIELGARQGRRLGGLLFAVKLSPNQLERRSLNQREE
jgi:hypothetical protein